MMESAPIWVAKKSEWYLMRIRIYSHFFISAFFIVSGRKICQDYRLDRRCSMKILTRILKRPCLFSDSHSSTFTRDPLNLERLWTYQSQLHFGTFFLISVRCTVSPCHLNTRLFKWKTSMKNIVGHESFHTFGRPHSRARMPAHRMRGSWYSHYRAKNYK